MSLTLAMDTVLWYLLSSSSPFITITTTTLSLNSLTPSHYQVIWCSIIASLLFLRIGWHFFKLLPVFLYLTITFTHRWMSNHRIYQPVVWESLCSNIHSCQQNWSTSSIRIYNTLRFFLSLQLVSCYFSFKIIPSRQTISEETTSSPTLSHISDNQGQIHRMYCFSGERNPIKKFWLYSTFI